MSDKKDIEHQLELLTIHRRSLAHSLKQRTMHGEAFVPSYIVTEIEQRRAEIKRIKAILRGWGHPVADHPDDDDQAQTPAPPPATGALSRSDLATLADLLVRSGRADADRRTALCLEIGVDRHRLPFLQAATSDFATQLVHHLKDIDDRDGLRALCQVLSQTLRGEPAERLAVLRQKLG